MLKKVAVSIVSPHLGKQLFQNGVSKKSALSFRGVSSDAKKVAVVLSGSGVYDGSEIHEASAVLQHLTRNCLAPCMFAPDIQQFHVINHYKGEEDLTHKRYVLQESARIARGNIEPLCKLIENQVCFDAVIFPGGFGVAKNLSDFASKGADLTIHPEVLKVIKDFHCAKKAQAFICIAPILAAKAICGTRITLGRSGEKCVKWPHQAAIGEAKKLGALVEEVDVDEYVFDSKNNVYSTPAFMYDGDFHEVHDGIGKMIKALSTCLNLKHQN